MVILGDPVPCPVPPLAGPRPWAPVFVKTEPWSDDRDFWMPAPSFEGMTVHPAVSRQVAVEVASLLLHPDRCELLGEPRESLVPGISERLPILLEDLDFWRTLTVDRSVSQMRADIAVLAVLLVYDPGGGGGAGLGLVGSEGLSGEGGEPEGQVIAVVEAPPVQYDQDQEILARLMPSLAKSSQVPSDQLERLVDMVRDRPGWASFLRLIGRLSSTAWSPPARAESSAREDVVDIEVGDDLSRIVPVELARFALPETASLAYVDLVQRRMSQIAVEGTEPRSGGPILVAVDVSGSMNDQVPEMEMVPRREVALILLVSLLRVADIQKREVRFCGFTTGVEWSMLARNPTEVAASLEFLLSELRCDGGTSFDPPLKLLCDWVRDSSRQGADLLFITDGESGVSVPVQKKVRRLQRSTGARLFTLLIDQEDGGSEILCRLSDHVVHLSSWDDLETLAEQVSVRR